MGVTSFDEGQHGLPLAFNKQRGANADICSDIGALWVGEEKDGENSEGVGELPEWPYHVQHVWSRVQKGASISRAPTVGFLGRLPQCEVNAMAAFIAHEIPHLRNGFKSLSHAYQQYWKEFPGKKLYWQFCLEYPNTTSK